MPSNVGEGRVVGVLVVRRNHLGLDGAFVAVGRSALDIIVLVLVGAAVKVGGTLVLVGTAVLLGKRLCQLLRTSATYCGFSRRTYVYLVMSSRISPEEYS